MTIQEQLDWLVENTTIIWIERHNDQSVMSGEKEDVDRFMRDQGDPISFTEVLEPFWQIKFNSFGDVWNEERQLYRLLYDSMRSFFASFIGLRMSKVASIETHDRRESVLQGNLAGSYLIQMYVSGKKCLDLLRELNVATNNSFSRQFAETRNKLFEHNYNPNQIDDLILEPSFWDLIATKSFLPIYIHTTGEREFEAYIDYYQDYYDLEEIFNDLVRNFR